MAPVREGELVARARGLAGSIDVLVQALDEVAVEALAIGVDRSVLADALGVSRSTLYRTYGSVLGRSSEGRSRPQADPRSAAEWG